MWRLGTREETARTSRRRGSGNTLTTTQVRSWSTNIDEDISVLAANSVEFEYDTETFKILDHIVTSPGIGCSAWFKDPDGGHRPGSGRPGSCDLPGGDGQPFHTLMLAMARITAATVGSS